MAHVFVSLLAEKVSQKGIFLLLQNRVFCKNGVNFLVYALVVIDDYRSVPTIRLLFQETFAPKNNEMHIQICGRAYL